MNYLPDVNFRHNTRAYYNRNREARVQREDYNPNNLGPRRIIQDAFIKYIQNTVIDNNAIAIQIVYVETPYNEDIKSLFIMKKKFIYDDQNERTELIRGNGVYVRDSTDSPREHFNNEIESVLNELSNFYIKEVNLCEIYHEQEDSPWTIPIKVLYKIGNPLETLGGLVTNLPVTESPFFRGYESGDACGICQDDLANGQEICVNRNCQHGFHCNCINDWFNGPTHPPRLCPACRQTWVNEKLPDAQQQIIQNMGFGKKKKSSEIKYLQSLC